SADGTESSRRLDSRILEVAEKLNIDVAEVRKLLSGVAGSKRQMILMGPPGTGKTFVAQEIASLLVDDPSCVKLVQFHPSYGYEDFIEGMRPVPSENGGLEFKQFPGVLLKMCREIADDGRPRVLIIDEINRANISKVFGELMFLLEYREKSIQIMLDGSDFSLPDQMFIIGTMNTADRSIRTLDVAMRRRFKFFELPPRDDVISLQYSKPGWVNSVGESLIKGFRKLNEQLLSDLDRHHTIGHSYFLHRQMSASHLRDVWDQEIFPLIEDYFFDRPHKAAEYQFSGYWPNV
ncbi:MAG: AAA family ATPase, partial [Planctomycetes bacterium]|nr:AAA family ATPase [Planctomycetota bacterium]